MFKFLREIKMSKKELSQEELKNRSPLNPIVLLSARHDTLHEPSKKIRVIKIRKKI